MLLSESKGENENLLFMVKLSKFLFNFSYSILISKNRFFAFLYLQIESLKKADEV